MSFLPNSSQSFPAYTTRQNCFFHGEASSPWAVPFEAQACRLLEKYNTYTFLVDRRANKSLGTNDMGTMWERWLNVWWQVTCWACWACWFYIKGKLENVIGQDVMKDLLLFFVSKWPAGLPFNHFVISRAFSATT